MSTPTTMKSVVVRKEILKSNIEEIPVPTPGPNEVLIRVAYAAANPKDWKMPQFLPSEYNTGDDLSGHIVSVGSSVTRFTPGQRVAAMHVMLAPHGSYAEYAIAPEHTTFHLPSSTPLSSAAGIPLAALTASYALRTLNLPDVFTPAGTNSNDPRPSGPFLVYGASTAVGAYAIKLAKIAKIHPIIAVAGNSQEFASSLGADILLDYRSSSFPNNIRQSLPADSKLLHAFDAVSTPKTISALLPILDEGARLIYINANIEQDVEKKPGVELKSVNVGFAHEQEYEWAGKGTKGDRDFAAAMCEWFGRALVEGRFEPHPVEVRGGLEKVGEGLNDLMEGRVSGRKVAFKVSGEE